MKNFKETKSGRKNLDEPKEKYKLVYLNLTLTIIIINNVKKTRLKRTLKISLKNYSLMDMISINNPIID